MNITKLQAAQISDSLPQHTSVGRELPRDRGNLSMSGVMPSEFFSMPAGAVEWLRFFHEQFAHTNVAALIQDVLDSIQLLTSVRTGDLLPELQRMADFLTSVLSGPRNGVSSETLRATVQLLSNADDVKIVLLRMLPLFSPEHQAAARLVVERFIQFLDTVHFFNQQMVREYGAVQTGLYIPLAFMSALSYGRKAELVVHPHYDGDGFLKEDEYECDLMIDTDTLGRLKIHLAMRRASVTVSVDVEQWQAKEAVQNNVPDLILRLRTKNVIVAGIKCAVVGTIADHVESSLPHVRLVA